MAYTIFYPGLGMYCRKYFVEGQALTPIENAQAPILIEQERRAIFEQLMLFDSISFKIQGENIAIALFINWFGQKDLEALLEEGAIKFTLWTPMVGYLENNVAGIESIVSGDLNSPAHCDPQQSAELGFNWMANPLFPKQKRHLVRKIVSNYNVTPPGMANDCLSLVKSAFSSGKLHHYGFDPKAKALDSFNLNDKKTFARCAEDILEYDFLIKNKMTSFSEYKFYSPFWDTAKRFRDIKEIKDGFWNISSLENFPNLEAVFSNIDEPFKKLPRLRNTRNAKRFREWLATNTSDQTDDGFVKRYIDSISERKGLFETAPAKFLKAAAMTAIGAGIGAFAAGEAGALVGVAGGVLTETTLDLAGHFSLDALDGFVWDSVTKGWTPRLFFNDLNRLRVRK